MNQGVTALDDPRTLHKAALMRPHTRPHLLDLRQEQQRQPPHDGTRRRGAGPTAAAAAARGLRGRVHSVHRGGAEPPRAERPAGRLERRRHPVEEGGAGPRLTTRAAWPRAAGELYGYFVCCISCVIETRFTPLANT